MTERLNNSKKPVTDRAGRVRFQPPKGTSSSLFLNPQDTSSPLLLKLSRLPSPEVASPRVAPILWLAATPTRHGGEHLGWLISLFQSSPQPSDPFPHAPWHPLEPHPPKQLIWKAANTSHLVSSCPLLHAAGDQTKCSLSSVTILLRAFPLPTAPTGQVASFLAKHIRTLFLLVLPHLLSSSLPVPLCLIGLQDQSTVVVSPGE